MRKRAIQALLLGALVLTGASRAEGGPTDTPQAVTAWAAGPQLTVGSHRPPEAPWRRRLRTAPRWLWILLFAAPGGAFALSRRGRKRQAALVSTALMAVSGGLAYEVVQRRIPEPPLLRGRVDSTPRLPPPGTIPVYAWGASTMHGDVYSAVLSIPEVVDWSLAGRTGERRLAVQNLARPGASLSEGLPAGIMQVLSQPEIYKPAAILLYIGHNEFSNARREGLAPRALDAELRWVVDRYRDSLRTIAAAARKAGARLFVALPTSNLHGHGPLQSRPDVERGGAEWRAMASALERAEAALRRKEPATALAAADEAARVSPKQAWAHVFRGRALRALGREAEAVAAFDAAWRLDSDRQRTRPEQLAVIRGLCAHGEAICVDASAAMRREFPWLDDAAFIDLHHPVARGHALIGEAFATAMAHAFGWSAPRAVPRRWPPSLDPTPATRERWLQTAAWYLGTGGQRQDPWTRREVERRIAACLTQLDAGLPHLAPDERATLARQLAEARWLFAAFRGDRQAMPALERRWRALAGPGAALNQPWKRALIANAGQGAPAGDQPR